METGISTFILNETHSGSNMKDTNIHSHKNMSALSDEADRCWPVTVIKPALIGYEDPVFLVLVVEECYSLYRL